MLRVVRKANQFRNLNGRRLSTIGPGKPVQTEKPRGTSFPIFIPTILVGLGYLAYKSETDSSIGDSVNKIPNLNYVLDPIKSGLRLAKLLPEHVDVKKEAAPSTAKELQPPASSTPATEEAHVAEHKTAASDVVESSIVSSEENLQEEQSVAGTKDAENVGSSDGEKHDGAAAAEESAPATSDVDANAQVSVVAEVASAALSAAKADAAQKAVEEDKTGTSANATTSSKSVSIPVMPSEELARATESTVLRQAIADSAREFIALRRDLEATLLKDIHTLNEHELRVRIKQLATEMFERLAWEDLRMSQSLKGVQSELAEKYTDLMRRQRSELELEVKKLLFALEQEAAQCRADARAGRGLPEAAGRHHPRAGGRLPRDAAARAGGAE